MSKRIFNPFTEPARGYRPLVQEDALLDSASAAKKGTNHVPLFHHQ